MASTCPHTTLPAKNYWLEAPQTDLPAKVAQQPAVKAAPAVNAAPEPALPLFEMKKPTPENNATADLERMFAIRDKELAYLAANNLIPPGYEKTESAPLQHSDFYFLFNSALLSYLLGYSRFKHLKSGQNTF